MVVFTGGTIGSMKQESGVDVNNAGSYMIIDKFQAQYPSSVAFTTMQPLNILSENMIASQWLELADQLRAIDHSKLDGIIVTHGSDTLAYTAAMLSYLLSDLTIPLILIASNYHLEDERANGLRNFNHAVSWIEEGAAAGVFAIYENNVGEGILYLGSRMMQCEPFTDQFRTPYDYILGKLVNGEVLPMEPASPLQITEIRPADHPYIDGIRHLKQLSTNIVTIKPYPGLDYTLFEWTNNKPQAIVHDVYHSGTANAMPSGPHSLVQFIRRCKEQGITVYLSPVKSAEEAQYASTAALLDAGAVLLDSIGPEAALTKLMLAYSLFDRALDIEKFMKHNLNYELHE